MGHGRLHKSEHTSGGVDSVNREKLAGIKDDIPRQLPSRSDYVKLLKTKSIDKSILGDDYANQVIEEGSFIYIPTGHRILKCNKSDLEVVNAYDVPVRPQGAPHIMCITTNYLYFATQGQEIVKLNKSDLSFVSSVNIGIYATWLITDGTFLYTIDYSSSKTVQKFDLNLNSIGTLALPWSFSWDAVYDSGFIYVEHEELGLTFSKIDLSSFTVAGTGDLSATHGAIYVIESMGGSLYMTAFDADWLTESVLKIDKTTLAFVAETTPIPLVDYFQAICGDGTHLYYNDAAASSIEKIDANLVPIETAVVDNGSFIGMVADANNVFSATDSRNPIIWYKYTKTSITKVDEEIGRVGMSLSQDAAFCSDGESIFYITEGQQRLHKLNIETFEDTIASTDLPSSIFYSADIVCDESKVYIVGYDWSGDYISRLVVCDINTLEILENKVLDINIYKLTSTITVDENYIYIGGSRSGQDSKVSKLNKQTYTLESQLTIPSAFARIQAGLVITKDYLFVRNTYGGDQVRIRKIDPTTMTEISFVEPTLTGSGYTSGMVYDGNKYLFYAADTYVNIIDTDTLTVTQVYHPSVSVQGMGIGNYLYTAFPSFGTDEVWIDVFDMTLNRLVTRRITLTANEVPNMANLSLMSNSRHLFVKGFLFFNMNSTIVRVHLGDERIEVHSQNTDIILMKDSGTELINAGILKEDLKTDRWLNEDHNTLLGIDVAGADTLVHSVGADGWYNTALGYQALYSITTAYNSVAIGYVAMYKTTTGYQNIAIGGGALFWNETGIRNVAIGFEALTNNTAQGNTAVGGSNCLIANTTGADNTAIGNFGMSKNTIGVRNTVLGVYSLAENIAGNNNVAIGYAALNSDTASEKSIGIGSRAGASNTGDNCVLIGYEAGDTNTIDSRFILCQKHINATPLIQGDFITGKVGIGIIPDSQLHIHHATAGDARFFEDGNAFLILDHNGGYNEGILLRHGGVQLWKIQTTGYNSNDKLFFKAGVGEAVRVTFAGDGKVGIGTADPTSNLQVIGLPEYADNAAALLGALTSGAFYRTGDILKIVH